MSSNMTICPVCEDTFMYTPTAGGCCGLGCSEKLNKNLRRILAITEDTILGDSEHLKQALQQARKNKPRYHRAWGGITLWLPSRFAKGSPKASHFGKAAVRIGKAALQKLILEAKALSEWEEYLEALEEATEYYSRDNPARPSDP